MTGVVAWILLANSGKGVGMDGKKNIVPPADKKINLYKNRGTRWPSSTFAFASFSGKF